MKMRFALGKTAVALAAVALVGATFAATRPAKKALDFTATGAAAPTFSGPAGVIVKIVSASIGSTGTISARVTITDRVGTPLDRLGIATPGPVTLSFICATIPNGQTQYVSYTTSVDKSGTNNNPPQTQAGNDSGGTFTTNALGDYTYTFATKAPAGFDVTATHSIGVSAYRNMSEFFTADEWSQSGNDVFTFVPNGATPTNTRQVVVTAACNQCHNPLNEHGGDRLLTQYCILCHQPQTVNPDTLNTMDMKVFIHKIHDASNLPSVKAGTPYQVYHRGAWENFSNIVFPQDVRNCTTCHTSAAAQNTAWKTNPSRAACGSCHDDVNFATGTNHVGLPQFDDTQCAYCHATPTAHDFDASIPGAHVVPNYSTSLPGLVVKVLGVTNTAAGSQPTISFSLFDKSGNPVDPTKITKFSAVLGGGNVDYGTGAAGIRVSETVTKVTGSAGTYSYTMTNKIPAGATGSYTIMLMATNNVTLLPGTVDSTAAVDNALPSIYYFSVDSSPVQARRVVVSTANCSACHSDLQFVHGGTRGNSQACGICHNPTLTDGTSKQSVNFAWQIHSIHRGSNLANPYILGTTNYQSILFPGDLRDCNTCHVGASYQVDNIGAKAPVVSTGGFTPTTLPTAAACQGCHDDIDTASHALANTTSLGESCVVCHGINGAFAVDTVHQRVQ